MNRRSTPRRHSAKKPSHVIVLGIPVRLSFTKKAPAGLDPAAYGVYRRFGPRGPVIFIRTSTPFFEQRNTLIHELVHIAADHLRMRFDTKTDLEDFVTKLADFFDSVLRDNPFIYRAYLANRWKARWRRP